MLVRLKQEERRWAFDIIRFSNFVGRRFAIGNVSFVYVCVCMCVCLFRFSRLIQSQPDPSLASWRRPWTSTVPPFLGFVRISSPFLAFVLSHVRFCDMLFKDTWTRTTRRTCTSWRMRSFLVGRSWLSGADERRRARAPRRARATRPPDSFELLQEVWTLEVLRHRIVQPRDHFIDGLLPALLRVLAALNRFEELFQRLLHNVPKVAGYLKVSRYC